MPEKTLYKTSTHLLKTLSKAGTEGTYFNIIKAVMTQLFHFWIYIKETENTSSKEYMHPYAHCSIIHNRQDMEATRVPTNRRVDKTLWYIFTMEYYLAIKQKQNLTTYESKDGPRELLC